MLYASMVMAYFLYRTASELYGCVLWARIRCFMSSSYLCIFVVVLQVIV